MVFGLKEYQRQCLEKLAGYLRRVNEIGANVAFYEATDRPYRQVEELPGLPYVCVRVPTGGGKTVMAAHAVGITAREFLHLESGLALWLVPTNTIREQTLLALRDRRHPYRQALDEAFSGNVAVMDIKEALYVQRGVLDSDTVIMVSTLAALRVNDTEGRKVYETAGALQHHFDGLKQEQPDDLEKLNGEEGIISYSLANVLRLRRPMVIVDEAHNARTSLSFEVLARFNPSCILEFTATPDQEKNPSNVLASVSALELKGEAMIKLPIRLKTKPQWTEAVAEAIAKQGELKRIAKEEEKQTGEYLRPIVLFQAQPKKKGEKTITYEVLRQTLIEDFKIKEEEIAIATAEKKELENINIADRECPIQYIITVAALKEGWDCPFAYILCSVTNLSSRTAVEQILGRVLRLPKVTWKEHEELNHAYAFATSREFAEAARSLTDALVESGFERFEAKTMVKPEEELPFGELPLFSAPVTVQVSETPNLKKLAKGIKNKITYEAVKKELIYFGPPIEEKEKFALQECFTTEEDKQAIEKLYLKSHGKEVYPAAQGIVFRVPMLAVRDGKQLEFFEDQFLDAQWNLAECEAELTEREFPTKEAEEKAADIDVDQTGRIGFQFVRELHHQLSFLDMRGPKTKAELANWLDHSINHPDIPQVQSSLFLFRLIEWLMENRKFQLEDLVFERYRLRDVISDKINEFRKVQTEKFYQKWLLPDFETPLEVSPELCFTFPLNQYPANRIYQGPARFSRHYYEIPADMNGEEAECAVFIDNLAEVKFWVRNLERDDCSFWLQTSTDKFYPDFVAELVDGRYLVVEYKGADRWSDDDSREKRALGGLWAERSGGRCLFVMPRGRDFEGIRELLGD